MATAYISNNQFSWVSREERPLIDRLITEVCQVDSSPNNLIFILQEMTNKLTKENKTNGRN